MSARTHQRLDLDAGPEPWGTTSAEVARAPHSMAPTHDVPAGTSPSLYNRDLAPTMHRGRTWNAYAIFTLWANDVHSLGNYAFAMGLFALGMGAWQTMLAFLIGAVFLFVLLTLSGMMGQRTGVPFPVMSRIAFGIKGAKVPAIVRGVVAIAWFGIQTYLASLVFRVMVIALWPSAKSWDANSILGLSTLGWLTFLILWVVQVLIVIRGMEMIRKYEAFAGPVILLTMLALAIWMLTRTHFSIAWSTTNSLSGSRMWIKIFESAALWVVIYGTFVLNFCDFSRGAPRAKSVIRGNFFGIPINMLFFAAIVVTLTGAQYQLNGKVIDSPTSVVEAVPNTFLLVLASLALIILTIAVNLMANFVAPIYMLADLFPKQLNFKRAAIVSAVVGLVILPWNLYNTPEIIVYFLGGLGALLGPLFGVIMADYWLIRKQQVDVPALYSDDPSGEYFYTGGVNKRAVIAGTLAAIPSLIVALVPHFGSISGFSWFVGAGLGAVIYVVIADKNAMFHKVSGECIAVPATH